MNRNRLDLILQMEYLLFILYRAIFSGNFVLQIQHPKFEDFGMVQKFRSLQVFYTYPARANII